MPVEPAVRLADGDHVVQFYRHDEELVGVVGGYLAAAVLDGDAVIVIATPDHGDAFRQAVVAAGVDVTAARGEGRLAVLDATATLSAFMVDGTPDPDAFDAVVGALVRRYGQGGRPVRAYGEMVALLWDAGNVAGAVELEALWNGLADRVPFSLFCAYPTHMVDDPGVSDAFADVCHLHTEVVAGAPMQAGAEATRRFVGTPHAPRSARRFVAETLQRWGRDDLVADGLIVAAELVTNAVLHASADVTVALSRHGDAVQLTVGDSSPHAPMPRRAGSSSLGGRGLLLVGAIAGRWGHRHVDGGKLVWAELRSDGAARTDADHRPA